MIGGFLGAGKTTAVLKLAEWLRARKLRAGLISNDQGTGLVDTAMFAAGEFPVQEIPGGCFCCRFNSLVEAAKKLTRASRPDVFIAEPVGSCTDLVATVSYPLRQLYGENFAIAPLSVLVDPVRAARVLGLETGGQFSEKVIYIYRKQLEEADVIVVNKTDLRTAAQIRALRQALLKKFPKAEIFEVSARRGDGLDEWFKHITSVEQKARGVMDVDYEIYADGEARLGWLNSTARFTARNEFDANAFLQNLSAEMQRRLGKMGAEIAHLKMTFDANSPFGELAAVNLVRNDFVPEMSLTIPDAVTGGELTVNLRAEGEPSDLRKALEESVAKTAAAVPGLKVKWLNIEAFKPGKPQPTHRVVSAR
ncbi:MAG: cobalamin biosynthesis protein P47K [Verrucomicrobia bacterium]|nr:cobalamin biosynthesis protein P47K [Verrucomicrobiota bacterium]